ncbi:unnamed protein product [Effrenium voratum]|uniref:Uncharacterized protein n=1 Tax=Effrenium voratum TaxID=2562239 RepID=A0AA36JTL4_9DINO|nr:unnamed protein product [Effrenium voratum]CAJ1411103.1 unnamed protein product [Effrenium voratum]
MRSVLGIAAALAVLAVLAVLAFVPHAVGHPASQPLADIGMSDVPELPTSPPKQDDPKEKKSLFKMLPPVFQDWYLEQKQAIQQQMEKAQVTYYKSPHRLVRVSGDEFLKKAQKQLAHVE